MDPKYRYFVPRATLLSLLPYCKVLHHAGKGIVRYQTVPGWFGEVALGGCVGTISLFMAVFLGKSVSEPTPLAEKQHHTCMVSGCFTVGMTQD